MSLVLGLIILSTGITVGYLSLPRVKTLSLKVKMATRKRRRRDGAINIELSDIKSTSTCISLGLTIRELCCDNCKTQLDAQIGMSKKSSVRTKRYRDYEESGRNRCQQPWASRNCRSTCHNSTIRKFNRIRKYWNIDTTVEIGGERINVEVQNIYCYSKKTQQSRSLNYNKDTQNRNAQPDNPNDNDTLSSQGNTNVDDRPTDPPSEMQQRPQMCDVVTTYPTLPSSTSETQTATIALGPPAIPLLLDALKVHPTPTLPVIDPIPTPPVIDLTPTPITPTIDLASDTPLCDTNSRCFTSISKSVLSRLNNEAKIGRQIRQKMNCKRYIGSPLGERLIGIAMMHAPKLSLECAEKLMPLFIGSFLVDCGIPESEIQNLGSVTPCAKKIKAIMIEETVDTILTDKKEIAGKPLTLMCDKGDGAGKRGGASFVKLIARWNEKLQRVRVTSIGIEGAGNTTQSGAEGIDHSLTLYDTPNHRVQVHGQGTDAGGGATREHLQEKLNEKGRVFNMLNYVQTTCTLHALNLTLSSPALLTMGEGGLKKRTALQVLHTAYNLAQQYSSSEWSSLWSICTGSICVAVKCPVLSRWEHVNECCEHVLKYKN